MEYRRYKCTAKLNYFEGKFGDDYVQMTWFVAVCKSTGIDLELIRFLLPAGRSGRRAKEYYDARSQADRN